VDLWIVNADGGEQRQLTKNGGGFNGKPRVTPDGRTVVFISTRTGLRQLWRMDADGGNPSQLVNLPENLEADHAVLPPDGAWVYFNPFGKGKGSIAKIPIGGGEPVSIRDAGWPLSISPNGKLLVLGFYDITSSQPWKNGIMSLENGEMLKVLEEGFRFVGGWTADSRSLVVVRDKDRSNLWLQPINGSEPRQLTKFDGGIVRSFAISPDFKRIAIARGNPSAEAVLITDF
jgi:Tol biopolymer transport system component